MAHVFGVDFVLRGPCIQISVLKLISCESFGVTDYILQRKRFVLSLNEKAMLLFCNVNYEDGRVLSMDASND